MLRHGPLRAPRSENALLMQWTHIATCAIFVKLRTQESVKCANIRVAYMHNAPAIPGRLREHTKIDYIYATIRLVGWHHLRAARPQDVLPRTGLRALRFWQLPWRHPAQPDVRAPRREYTP